MRLRFEVIYRPKGAESSPRLRASLQLPKDTQITVVSLHVTPVCKSGNVRIQRVFEIGTNDRRETKHAFGANLQMFPFVWLQCGSVD